MTISLPGSPAQAATRTRRQAAARALDFVSRSVSSTGAPSALLSLDPGFEQCFTGARARGILREHFGVDPGFDLAGEAFSAMVSLTLLPLTAHEADPHLILRLATHVKACRWRARYRFFPGSGGFPADTDCTALATAALFEHGLLTQEGLERGALELLRSAALPRDTRRSPDPRDEDRLSRGVFTVYWEDGEEPAALRRGHKQDEVAAANALYTLLLAEPDTAQTCAVVEATTRHLADHLDSGRYLAGTRYYPSPDAFLYALSRLCARFPAIAAALAAPARKALAERDASTMVTVARTPANALETALRTLAADHLGITTGQEQRQALLTDTQRLDGSWPPAAYYRMGRFPVYFGSPYLTTVFAMNALRTHPYARPTERSSVPAAAPRPHSHA
ncbi:hypothetical protein ACGFMM_24690 [Streptomyces sp. NPDC048604]|uniref:hypothetical protein n=1 Tax=Streptomyces sp. NPDC048604 TaxID=3365578 RepID=UPI00371CF0CF